MKRYITALVLFLIHLCIYSQEESFICGYTESVRPNFCQFVYDDSKNIDETNVLEVIDEILKTISLDKKSFFLKKCANINNAYAYCSVDGTRYIVIDESWLNQINNRNWFIIGVLAHEIGHHLNGHTINSKILNLSERRQQELEADRFSGSILKNLGASQIEATAWVNTIIPFEESDEHSTHPSKSKRISAIKAGYNGVELRDYTSKESYEDYFVLGYEYFNQKDFKKSYAYYQKALEINPKGSMAYNNIANIYYYVWNNLEEALKYYQIAINLDSRNYIAWHNLGDLTILGYNDYKKAFEYYNQALKLEPNYGKSLCSRGVVYLQYNMKNEACVDFRKACLLGVQNGCDNYQYNRCSN